MPITPLCRSVLSLAFLGTLAGTAELAQSSAAQATSIAVPRTDRRILAGAAACRRLHRRRRRGAQRRLSGRLRVCSRSAPRAAEPEASNARVVLGLLAWENGRGEDAERLLAQGPGPLALEDLRLFVLAESRAARGENRSARMALEALLRATPESSLRRTTLLKLAALAFADNQIAESLAYIERGRDEPLSAMSGSSSTLLPGRSGPPAATSPSDAKPRAVFWSARRSRPPGSPSRAPW